MDTELQKIQQEGQLDNSTKELPLQPSVSLADYLDELSAYGGLRLVKMLIHGTENFDPRKKAVHDIFLSDPFYKDERKRLAKTLDVWIEMLENKELSDADVAAELCARQCTDVERSISNNLFTIRESIKELETTYRVLDTFFANTENSKVDFLHLMNVNKAELREMDSPSSKAVAKELHDKYDTLNLRESYALFVIPGFLGSAQQIQDWAKVAHVNKTLMITDFEDSLTYEDLVFRLNRPSLQDSNRGISSAVVVCNYILGRRKSELSAEEEDLYIPASGAIAGRMTDVENISISQGVAGRKYGTLNRVPTVRFELLKSELTKLIDMGVVPLIEIDGQVMAFSNRTPYDGAMQELQEYPIVRVFDWVSKVIMQFCNDEAFVIWDASVRSEMTDNLQRFLDKYKGSGKLYENYMIKGINQDPQTKNILVQVELKPFFAARNFLIELTGKSENGKMTMTWEDNMK